MLHDGNGAYNPTRQHLRPVKIVDPDYEKYCNLLLNGVWKHRAPHANRPTPPKRKWAWGLAVAPGVAGSAP